MTKQKTSKIRVYYEGSATGMKWTSDGRLSVCVDGEGYHGNGHEDVKLEMDIDPADENALCDIAERCGLDGTLTEIHSLVYALRCYAAIATALGIDRTEDTDWTPYGSLDLDTAEEEDYTYFCDTVAAVFGRATGENQRTKLGIFSANIKDGSK